jgi:hypothetical protein
VVFQLRHVRRITEESAVGKADSFPVRLRSGCGMTNKKARATTRATATTEADSFPVRLRSGCGMTNKKKRVQPQGQLQRQGQKQIPSPFDYAQGAE